MSTQSDRIKRAAPDHPIHELLASRWSPYAYDPRPVDDDTLLQCLEAARWAASSYNEQPWSYIIAKREDESAYEKMLSCLMEANQQWAKNASVLIITVVKRQFSKNNKPNRVCEHDVGLAAGNLCVQAAALGLHVHQMAGIDISKCRAAYNIPSDGYDPMTAIAIGYAAEPEQFDDAQLADRDRNPRSRRPLKDWVFAAKWAEAAAVVGGSGK